MNVKRAIEVVWSLHLRGGRVLTEADAENLVRIVILALGPKGDTDDDTG
jgi:hypothetical protein